MTYVLGRIRHSNGTFSDRGYLSWSSYNLWRTNRNEYRRRYYLNEKAFESAATLFGKIVHKKFEEDESIVGSETSIEVKIDEGLTLLGYIDSLHPETLLVIDFKTGRDPWNDTKVSRHGQLVFYAMLVLLKHGTYNPKCELHWHETRNKKRSVEFDGHTLEADSGELELTGRIEIFSRKIYRWELEKLRQNVLLAAKEIHQDYEKWQQENQQKQTSAR